MKPETRTVEITTEYIKLDSLLKLAGIAATGGQAKEIVLQGSVLLNGEPVSQRGRKVRPGDRVQVDHYVVEVVASAVP